MDHALMVVILDLPKRWNVVNSSLQHGLEHGGSNGLRRLFVVSDGSLVPFENVLGHWFAPTVVKSVGREELKHVSHGNNSCRRSGIMLVR